MMSASGFSLNQLTRDYWGSFDGLAIAQSAVSESDDACYTPKFYKAPDDGQDLVPGFGFVVCGLKITPGSRILGFCLPCAAAGGSVVGLGTGPDAAFTVQITDQSVKVGGRPHQWFSDPLASLFLANYKPTFQNSAPNILVGSSPHFLKVPYPVVGSGLFDVEIQSASTDPQRIQLVFIVDEVCKP